VVVGLLAVADSHFFGWGMSFSNAHSTLHAFEEAFCNISSLQKQTKQRALCNTVYLVAHTPVQECTGKDHSICGRSYFHVYMITTAKPWAMRA